MESKNALEIINEFYDDENECINKKAEYFDKIAKLFYEKNFGSTNKSEIELLYNACISSTEPFCNTSLPIIKYFFTISLLKLQFVFIKIGLLNSSSN